MDCSVTKFYLEDIERIVLTFIRNMACLADEILKEESRKDKRKTISRIHNEQASNWEAKIDNLKSGNALLFEKLAMDNITQEEYACKVEDNNKEIERLRQKISEAEAKVSLIPEDKIEDVQKLIKLKDTQTLTRELATEMIADILLFEDKEIEMKWIFQNVFEMLIQCGTQSDYLEKIS